MRVCVTGLGVVSSHGDNLGSFWANLLSAKDGSCEVDLFDVAPYETKVACLVPPQPGEKRKLCGGRTTAFALRASQSALIDAQWMEGGPVGVVIGTTTGELNYLEVAGRKGWPKDQLVGILRDIYPCNSIAESVSQKLDLTGPTVSIPTACTAGNHAIIAAFEWIVSGVCTAAIACGADALSLVAFNGFSRLFSLTTDKCRPFDRKRKGLIIGEGAGALLLESVDSAAERGVRPYAEIIGFGMASDAFHPTIPHPAGRGLELALARTFTMAGIHVDEIDFICAHGTGTKANDRVEAQTLRRFLGDRADATSVTSLKSMIGHAMGAASALEAVACCLSIKDNIVPPTLHYEEPDSECPIRVVAFEPERRPVRTAINLAAAFGGNNSCILFRAV